MIERHHDPDAVLLALAHPVRRDLVARIARGDATVGELAAAHPITLAAVSRHLQVLERAGLIARRRQGREFHFEARREPLDDVQRLLDGLRLHWTSALDRLAALAEDPAIPTEPRRRNPTPTKTKPKTKTTPRKRSR